MKYILKESELKEIIINCINEAIGGGNSQGAAAGNAPATANLANIVMSFYKNIPEGSPLKIALGSKIRQAAAKNPLHSQLWFGIVKFIDGAVETPQGFPMKKLWYNVKNRGGNQYGLYGDVSYGPPGGDDARYDKRDVPADAETWEDWVNSGGQPNTVQIPGRESYVMSNLVNFVLVSPNHPKEPRKSKVTKITIHCTGGVDTAEGLGRKFQGKRQASSNYGIGNDGKIGMYVPENFRAWTSSWAANDEQAITIEVSNSRDDNGVKLDFNKPNQWPISIEAAQSLIKLCRDICSRYGITAVYTGDASGSFTEHRMFAPKACPGPYIHNGLAGKNGEEGWLIRAIKGENVYPPQYSEPMGGNNRSGGGYGGGSRNNPAQAKVQQMTRRVLNAPKTA